MNELDLQSALYVLGYSNMGLTAKIIKRPGAELQAAVASLLLSRLGVDMMYSAPSSKIDWTFFPYKDRLLRARTVARTP